MNLPPYAVNLLGAVGMMIVPSIVILLSTYLAARSKRYATRRWPSETDAERRDAVHTANAWGELYDAHDGRLGDLERRVSALEARRPDDSSGDLTALSAVVNDMDKIKRSLRKVKLWDSTRPGQVT